jgi:hypothetical protein
MHLLYAKKMNISNTYNKIPISSRERFILSKKPPAGEKRPVPIISAQGKIGP